MMGNKFYYVVTMKMNCNLKYNCTVACMDTKKLAKVAMKSE